MMKLKNIIKFYNSNYYSGIILLLMLVSLAVKSEEIKIGMSTALSGQNQSLGLGIKLGVETYFQQINHTDGVNGRHLKLIVYDDGYEPQQTSINMRKLIFEDKVLAIIGNVGTPTAIVAVPIANENQTLLFGAITGAEVLRPSPPDRYIINFRASYAEETAAIVNGLVVAGIKPSEIAFFTQNDGYGDAGYQGAIRALKHAGYETAEDLAHGRYTSNTEYIENALVTIVYANPKAIIMVGTYQASAKFIKLAKQFLPNTIYANVSLVNSMSLAQELEASGEGVIVTQVVPHFNADLPGVVEFRQALAQYSPNTTPDFGTLEGYLLAKILVAGLQQAGEPLTREGLVDAMETLNNLDIGIDVPISFSKTHHQASHQIWPTIIKEGQYVSFDWADLKP